MSSASEKGHTPEPWHGPLSWHRRNDDDRPHFTRIGLWVELRAEDYDYAVERVNALSGLDPSAIPEVVGLLSRLLERFEYAYERGGTVHPAEITQYPCQETTWVAELRAALGKLRKGEG